MSVDPADHTFARHVIQERGNWLLAELARLKRHPRDESIHDTRVQSRRMRAALEMFQDLLPRPAWQALYHRVKRITRVLGEAREAETMILLLQSLTAAGDATENVCREYLQEKLEKKLGKLKARIHRELGGIDLRHLRSKITDLLSGLNRPPATVPDSGVEGRDLPAEADRLRSVFTRAAVPLLGFRRRHQFQRASDQRLHRLRIAAKKLRYTLEILDPVWPGGLKTEIALSRGLQDAAGLHQDWSVLRAFLQNQIRRLMRQSRTHMAFQVGRLLATAEDRKAELRSQILPVLTELQATLRRQLGSAPDAHNVSKHARELEESQS
jgi:CHAD domain-containing protein